MNDSNDSYLKELGYLRLKSVLEIIPISRSTWYLWVQCGIAPKSTSISLRVAAWKVRDIKDLLIEMDKPDWRKNLKQKLNTYRNKNV